MKKKSIVIIFLLGTLIASAIKVVDTIIERLGMEQKFVQGNIVSNLVGSFSSEPMASYEDAGGFSGDQPSSFRLPYVPKLKLSTIISGDKVGAAEELCEYVKKYINSEEFIIEYSKQRESAMPLTDNGTALSTLKANVIVFQKNINNYKTDTKYVAEQQKQLDETQKKIDALTEAAKKPFAGKANWEKRYPADPSSLVRKRLEEYLQLAGTVDFNAALTVPDKYKVVKFVNPAFEKKSYKWKAIFRAGKDVTEAINVFVKEWLKGEIISKEKMKMIETGSIDQQKNEPTQTKAAKSNNSTTASSSNAASTSETATTVKKEKAPVQKKSGLKNFKNKLGTIIKN